MCYKDKSYLLMLSEIMENEDQKILDILYYIQHMIKPFMLYNYMKTPNELADEIPKQIQHCIYYFFYDFISYLPKLTQKYYFETISPLSTQYTCYFDFDRGNKENNNKFYIYEGMSMKEFER